MERIYIILYTDIHGETEGIIHIYSSYKKAQQWIIDCKIIGRCKIKEYLMDD